MKRLVILSAVLVAAAATTLATRSYLCGDAAMAGATKAGDACAPSTASTTAATAGKTLNADPELSAICQKACAARVPYKEAELVSQPGAKIGNLTRCPVSGVVFKVGITNPTVKYKGVAYRTCCSMCSKRFRAQPARFVTA